METQTQIPGTDGDMHQDIEDAAAALQEAQQAENDCAVAVSKAKGDLEERMREHKLERYGLRSITGKGGKRLEVVTTTPQVQTKIRAVKDADDEERSTLSGATIVASGDAAEEEHEGEPAPKKRGGKRGKANGAATDTEVSVQ